MLAQIDKKSVGYTLDWKPSVAEAAVALGRKHHGHYEILPVAGVIDKPVILQVPGDYNGWRVVPRQMDTSFVPGEADRHVRLLREAGFVIQQELILHEPTTETEPKPHRDYTQLKEAGTALAKVMVAGLTVAVAVMGFAAYALAIGVMTDPALVVVLEDGAWVIVCKWDL